MNDFQGLFSGDYGFKPQIKSAPMAPSRSNHNTANSPFDFDFSGSSSTAPKNAPPYSSKFSTSSVSLDDQDDFFFRPINPSASQKNRDFGNSGGLDDVSGASSKSQTNSSINLDSVFSGLGDSESKFSSLPVFDKPVYDDDELDGVPGLKNLSSAKYEGVFSSPSLKTHDAFDDILGEFSRNEPESEGLGVSGRQNETNATSFDDLLPGFGASTAHSDRNLGESRWDKRSSENGMKKATSGLENPFGGLSSNSSDALSSEGLYADQLEQFAGLGGFSRKKTESVSVSEGLFDDIDHPAGLGKSLTMNDREKVGSPARIGKTMSSEQTSASVEFDDRSASLKTPSNSFGNTMAAEDYYKSSGFKTFSAPEESHNSALNTPSSSFVNGSDEAVYKRPTSTVIESNLDSSDDLWLTVSEVPLLTQPTAAPPPSRPPPPKPPRISKVGSGPYPPLHEKKIDEHLSFPTSAQFSQRPKSDPVDVKSSFTSPIDELEDFARGRNWNDSDGKFGIESSYDLDGHSEAAAASADAMKEAMDRAEARFKHAKEARERENAKSARMQQEREDFLERDSRDIQERLERQRQRREEEERKQNEEEEKLRREREEREREQRRIERERIERERARQAVERATREARERAAADARARAEKAAVGKVQAEARERAERAAVMKAQAEARERAARAAVEAKKRADREKAEREAKEKEAYEKAAAASARAANHQKNEDDLDSIFGMGSRANTASKDRTSSSDPLFDPQFPKKQSGSVRTASGSTPSTRKTSSASIVDDLSSVFGGAPSAGDFHDVEGETEERRRSRLERHQRTQERAAKALAEKNKRDLDAQKEQAERHRIAETLDVEIKRWAAGKEGNLRALLSTMHYVLWPECGWQQVSLTDLITAAAVKKAYRKATLCIHPDKVQQKGANLQQKYIAEKVFDLLKEAWNKFNSEELF